MTCREYIEQELLEAGCHLETARQIDKDTYAQSALFELKRCFARLIDAARLLDGIERREPDTCPECGGPANCGSDREYPPNPYVCSECTRKGQKASPEGD